VAITSRGNISVRDAGLDLQDYGSLVCADGAVLLFDSTLESTDGLAKVILSGGTTGGSLRGSGTIGAELQNGGWLEPAGPGFSITGDYTQLREGNLHIAGNAATGGQAPVRISGAAIFAGSLWMNAQ
jgi:hypothetical protein